MEDDVEIEYSDHAEAINQLCAEEDRQWWANQMRLVSLHLGGGRL